jgi:hypothetical protein
VRVLKKRRQRIKEPRSVLGLIFIWADGFFRFLHQPSFQTPAARELMTVMQATPHGYMVDERHLPNGSRLVP